jgi:glycosyltransferase involved in cell wall biosynthesis
MMTSMPAISIILPVYNAEKYIDEAIQSVLAQTFTHFELLLIDDGSTDSSLARLQHFAKQDARCVAYSTKNCGIVTALNFGISQAKAAIICRMDADDICMPQRFEKQFNYLNAHPECVAVGSNVLLIDPEGMPIVTWTYLSTHEEIDNLNLTGGVGSCMCHPAVAIRKSSLLAVGAYRAEFEYAEDYDLFLRLAEIGKLANLPEMLLKYRQHPASIGHAKRKEQLMKTQKALEETSRRRELPLNHALNSESISRHMPISTLDTHIKWAWWALSEKYYSTAIKHGFKALKLKPFRLGVYHLLACVAKDYLLKK